VNVRDSDRKQRDRTATNRQNRDRQQRESPDRCLENSNRQQRESPDAFDRPGLAALLATPFVRFAH